MRVLAVLAVGCLALAVGVVAILSHEEQHLAGANWVLTTNFVTDIQPGAVLCQHNELVPRDAAGVQMTLGAYGRPGPAVEVVARKDGRTITRGRLAPGWTEGVVEVPVRRVERTILEAEVCLRNRGPRGAGRRARGEVAVGGMISPFPPGTGPAELDGQAIRGRARIEYPRAGEESWGDLIGVVAHRFGNGRAAFMGAWALWLALAATLAAFALAAWALVRSAA